LAIKYLFSLIRMKNCKKKPNLTVCHIIIHVNCKAKLLYLNKVIVMMQLSRI
jgi:hypothetical protein